MATNPVLPIDLPSRMTRAEGDIEAIKATQARHETTIEAIRSLMFNTLITACGGLLVGIATLAMMLFRK